MPAQSASDNHNGIRPVDLRRDLSALADLIELVFADSMDSSGRAALREMRTLSRMGPGLRVLVHLNEMAMGISLGYVWVEEGRLIGNVSVYPANWPQSFGQTYIIANVGVHPDYRGRGIARQLMEASMAMIASRGGKRAILQVDDDNDRARPLYRQLGFVEERTFITWRRTASGHVPAALEAAAGAFIRSRRRSEWRKEYALAEQVRPQSRGGLGWMRPLHPSVFKRNFWQRVGDFINLRSLERRVALPADRGRDDEHLAGSLWVQSMLGSPTRLTLLVPPDQRGVYDDLLLNWAVRRYGRSMLLIEHPADEEITTAVIQRYNFRQQRAVVHMRWDVPASY